MAASLPCARGADFFLTLGGGYDATGNQLSLERNVQRFQQVLADLRPDNPPHEIYFADGDDDGRDLQVLDDQAAADCPPARRIMTELFGDDASIGLRYRNHEVENVVGHTSPSQIKRRLRKLAGELKSGDRLFIYATGHGGGATGEYDDFEENFEDYYGKDYEEHYRKWAESKQQNNNYDTSFYLWDMETVTASELAGWLDGLRSDVTVVMVMVQCYSGGFSHAVFHNADESLGISPQVRCGFFSQTHDRPAAGCTPDTEKAGYDEYSGYFWSALAGKSPQSEAKIDADYNTDGTVSFAEAHAYAVIESDTVDIPIRTSGALLRRYSRLGKHPSNNEGEDDEPLGGLLGIFSDATSAQKPTGELMRATGKLRDIAEHAQPDQRAILEQLPQRLGLSRDSTVADVRSQLKKVERRLKRSRRRYAAAATAYSNVHEKLVERVKGEWPELNDDHAPLCAALCNELSDEFTRRVESMPVYEAMRTAGDLQEQASNEMLAVMHAEARLQRLLRTVDNIVLAANLPKTAPAEIVERYQQMLAVEEAGL